MNTTLTQVHKAQETAPQRAVAALADADLAAFRHNPAWFDHERLTGLGPSAAELAARIHTLGRIDVTLIYRTGDEEAGSSAAVLFDECLKRVFNTEDAVAIASRVGLGWL